MCFFLFLISYIPYFKVPEVHHVYLAHNYYCINTNFIALRCIFTAQINPL